MQKSAVLLAVGLVCLLVGLHPAIASTGASTGTILSVDINTASAEQLAEALPGIGPTKAARIVQWRKDNGAFKQVEQLQEVKGIGVKTIEKLRKYVRIGSAAEAKFMQIERDAEERNVQADIRRILDAAKLAATPQSIELAPSKPWFKRSAMQLLRAH